MWVEQTPLRTPQKRSADMKARRALKDRNSQLVTPDTTCESFISNINASLASAGTYSEFQVGSRVSWVRGQKKYIFCQEQFR